MADSEKSERLENGTIFKSRYEIVGFLGEGGFATVYKAVDVEIGREVAIKILHVLATIVDPSSHLSIVERFRQEARTAARIKHPAVVTIFDVGMTDDNHPYIIMDSLVGNDLEHELEEHGPMKLERALPLFCRCLEALSEAHRMGIVHKDLKPSNLFMVNPRTPYENISILDFGIARVTQDTDARLTSAGQILGTPRYMAPEYIDSQTVSPATDVYQMGLILIEMLTGLPVVGQETLISCIMVHAQGVEIPDHLVDTPLGPILAKAVEKDPAERYQDCDTFLNKLYNTDFTPMGLPNAAAVIQTRTTTARMLAISKENPVIPRPPDKTKPDTPDQPPKKDPPKKGGQTALVNQKKTQPDPITDTGGGGGGSNAGGRGLVKGIIALAVVGFISVAALVGLHFTGIIQIPFLPAVGGETVDTPKKDGPEALVKKGEGHMKKGEWKDAIKAFGAALDAKPKKKLKKKANELKEKSEKEKKLKKHFDAGHAALEKGDIKKANAKFDKIPKDSFYTKRVKEARKEVASSKIKAVEKALKAGDVEAAQEAFGIASLLDPKNKALRKLSKKMPRGGPMIALARAALTRGTNKDDLGAALKLCQDSKAKGESCSARTFTAEQPEKTFGMKALLIDKYEVTNKSYTQCVDAKKCTAPRYTTTCGGEDASIKAADHPVVCVTWEDAKAFCEWADKRLPSEAEWEYAARGAVEKDKPTRIFPWGADWKPTWTNWADGGKKDKHKWTSPVGAIPKDASAVGALDMGGNVAEWTVDWFDAKYYNEKPSTSPINGKKSATRSVRGGSWKSGGHTTRTAWRFGLSPDKFNSATGFRCAADKKK